jgi:hypothetical protein
MPYFIFLKSLRSLEKFKKNPHIKIPPKSPFINFQSLGIFKNLIFILKRNSLQFWPNQPTGLFGLFGPRGPPPAFLPPPAEPVSSLSRSRVTTPPPPGPPWPRSSRCQSRTPLLLYSLVIFNSRINPKIDYSRNFAKRLLGFFEIKPQSTKFHEDP